jgi:hypothetical protein
MKRISEQSLVFAGAVILSVIARNLLLAPVLNPYLVAGLVDPMGEGLILEQVIQ